MSNPEQPVQDSGSTDERQAGAEPEAVETTQDPTQQTQPEAATSKTRAKVQTTRMGIVWTTLVIAAIVLVLLLIFIVQNLHTVPIYFFGATGHLPAGVALLLAAVGGIVLVAVPGYGRILQLRKAVRKAGGKK